MFRQSPHAIRATFVTMIAALLLLVMATGARASIVLDADTYLLQPDSTGQVIDLHAHADAGETVTGVDLNVQVGALMIGNGDDFPTITNVDLTGPGTIFHGNNTGQGGTGSFTTAGFPSLWHASTSTATGSINPDGLLARITVDTTGYDPSTGPFDFRVINTLNGNTTFTTTSAETIQKDNGQVQITPEPGSVALLAAGALVLFTRRRGNRAEE